MSVWLKPFTKVFLSADLINSTQMKINLSMTDLEQDADHFEHSAHWYQVMLRFYYGFNNSFLTQIHTMRDKLATSDLDPSMAQIPAPRIWKVLGDELLYECDIKNEYELLHLINCFWTALTQFNQNRVFESEDGINRNQKVKGTVWMGVFPIINEVIFLRPNFRDMVGDMMAIDDSWTLDQINLSYEHSENGSKFIDFLGPDIDIGFKLKSMATRRKLILSHSVSYAFASAMYDLKNEDMANVPHNSQMFFESVPASSSDINDTDHMPIFWLDLLSSESQDTKISYNHFLDEIENRKSVSPDKVILFLHSYYKSGVNVLHQPIIPGSRKFGTFPTRYKKLLDLHRKRYSQEIERSRRMRKALSDDSEDTVEQEDVSKKNATSLGKVDKKTSLTIRKMLNELIPKPPSKGPRVNKSYN